MFRLNGTMFVEEKPDKIFTGVTNIGQACLTMHSLSYMIIVLPGFRMIQESQTLLNAFLHGQKNPLLSDWNLWKECGGKVSSVIPFALLK